MNPFQFHAWVRQKRRFSRGDGVTVLSGPYKGRQGIVMGFCSRSDADAGKRFDLEYDVRFLGDGNEGEVFASAQLQSAPALNVGKYGGPERGGEAGGWLWHRTNRYRNLRP